MKTAFSLLISLVPLCLAESTTLTPAQAQEQTELARRYVTADGVEQNYAKAIELLIPAAEAGNLLAIHSLGFMYTEGMGVEKDGEKGMELIKKAAEAGLQRSQEALAAAYIEGGHGVPQDTSKAIIWMEKAAAQGGDDIIVAVVNFFTYTAENPARALYWLEEGAKQGIATCQSELGYRLMEGIGTEIDKEKGLIWTQKAADQEFPEAIGNLSVYYLDPPSGKGPDYAQVFKWAQKGALLNDATACNSYGLCLLEGWETEQDAEKGIAYLKKAAEQDDPNALRNLATVYRTGKYGVAQNMEKAIAYSIEAAELGMADSMLDLGLIYMDGIGGVTVDAQKGYYWTKKAAEAGNLQGMSNLSFLLREGAGCEVDVNEAFQWAQRAAEQQYPMGIFNLAVHYLYGIGCEKDEQKAHEYLQKAAELGEEDAVRALLDLNNEPSS